MAKHSKSKERINDKEKQVYDAPIRIVNQKALRNYGITWKDCETLYVGGIEPMNVYMYETDNPEVAAYYWAQLNTEHSRNCRSTSGIVPGKQKPLIVCPDCTSAQTVLMVKSLKTVSQGASIMMFRKN